MTKAEFENEKNYRVSITIAKEMLSEGIINMKEFKKIDSILVAKYKPLIGSL